MPTLDNPTAGVNTPPQSEHLPEIELTDAERETLCICAEAGNDSRTETEVIALCNAHRCRVERIIAARMDALVLHICWERFDCSREWADCDHGFARALVYRPIASADTEASP